MTPPAPLQVSPDCPLCPRLVAFRADNAAAFPGYHNAPVNGFGPLEARVAIVGLAPGLHGANRTGRPFTGDYAGDLLYETLAAFGFATGTYDKRPDDGLALTDLRIVNGVRCVPPQNKPTGAEINACRPFLKQDLAAMPRLQGLVALGRIAHETALRAFGLKPSGYRFAHGALHEGLPQDLWLIDSYHCSRYNTQTNRLTPQMFADVFRMVTERLR